jgi:hypothetical protein
VDCQLNCYVRLYIAVKNVDIPKKSFILMVWKKQIQDIVNIVILKILHSFCRERDVGTVCCISLIAGRIMGG